MHLMQKRGGGGMAPPLMCQYGRCVTMSPSAALYATSPDSRHAMPRLWMMLLVYFFFFLSLPFCSSMAFTTCELEEKDRNPVQRRPQVDM